MSSNIPPQIQCTNCQFVWCFKCHAPWHEGLKCRDYRKGDKLLRHWASVIEHGQRNAQKCPRCKVFSFLLLNKEFSVLCRCIPTFKTPQLKICNGIDVTMSTLSYAHPHLVPLVPVHYSATCWGNWLDLISHAKILANHNVLYCSKVWVRSHL